MQAADAAREARRKRSENRSHQNATHWSNGGNRYHRENHADPDNHASAELDTPV